MNPESVEVTAGLGGFLAFFLLAVALYFLMRNMNARLRRMAYRQEQARSDEDGPRPPQAGGADRLDSEGPRGGSPASPDLG